MAPQVFLLSYPRAGRTWLRALVGRALLDAYGLPESQLLDTPALTRAAGLPLTVFDHDRGKGKVGGYAEYPSLDDIADIDAAIAARGCDFARPLQPA